MKVEVNGIQLSYEDKGEGLPVLFIHGFPFDHTMWNPQLEDLSNEHRVITPDLRGFGDSDIPNDTSTMNQFAADLIALLDLLKIDQAVICGLSMGGYISLAIAESFPERMLGLVLSNTRSAKDTIAVRQNRYNTAEKVLSEGNSFLAQDMAGKLLCQKTVAERPDLVEFVRDMIQRQNVNGIYAALRGMAERKDRTHLLSDIDVPTLVITGAEDSVIPVIESKRIVKEIPLAYLEIIEDSGHLSNLEQSAPYNKILHKYLESLSVHA